MPAPVLVGPLFGALVEERQSLVAVRHEASLLHEAYEHLRFDQQREELLVGLVAAAHELVELEQGFGVGRADRRRLDDGQEEAAVATKDCYHELEEGLLNTQFVSLL